MVRKSRKMIAYTPNDWYFDGHKHTLNVKAGERVIRKVEKMTLEERVGLEPKKKQFGVEKLKFFVLYNVDIVNNEFVIIVIFSFC